MDNEKKIDSQDAGKPQEQANPKQGPGKIPGYHTSSFVAPDTMPAYDQILKQDDEILTPPAVDSLASGEFVKNMVEKLSEAPSKIASGSSIPRFGLVGGILSEERKLASQGRNRKKPVALSVPQPQQSLKSPQKTEPLARPEPVVFKQPSFSAPPQSPQHRIISEIVAKEITFLLAMPSVI
ncbi:MAG: hypothetical protein K8R02_00690 [Anaerohalosphaeraceae bacterium]|nr:hypothetical protein [Anaerohalosphaeraceae bacterium]